MYLYYNKMRFLTIPIYPVLFLFRVGIIFYKIIKIHIFYVHTNIERRSILSSNECKVYLFFVFL